MDMNKEMDQMEIESYIAEIEELKGICENAIMDIQGNIDFIRIAIDGLIVTMDKLANCR
jgi:hypothetical protein